MQLYRNVLHPKLSTKAFPKPPADREGWLAAPHQEPHADSTHVGHLSSSVLPTLITGCDTLFVFQLEACTKRQTDR